MRPLEFDSDSDIIDADEPFFPPPPPPPATTSSLIGRSSTIDADADYDPPSTRQQHRTTALSQKYGWHMELSSILLFILGSVLYLVCAVYDYQWSQTLLQVPEWLRGADDDELWMRYRLEERYGDVSSLKAPDDSGRRMGGARRRLMRQMYWRIDEYEDNIMPILEENEVEASRKLQQTPEEKYYDLDWECLPVDVRRAYRLLGYNQSAWDNGVEVEADNMDWSDLTPEQREAALFLGYTEIIWCELDDAFEGWPPTLVPTESPTIPEPMQSLVVSPTPEPSQSPVASPTTKPSQSPIVSPSTKPTLRPTRMPITSTPSKAPLSASLQPSPSPIAIFVEDTSETAGADSIPPTETPTETPTEPTRKPTSEVSKATMIY